MAKSSEMREIWVHVEKSDSPPVQRSSSKSGDLSLQFTSERHVSPIQPSTQKKNQPHTSTVGIVESTAAVLTTSTVSDTAFIFASAVPSLSLQQAIRDNATTTVDKWIKFLSTIKDDEKKKILNERDEYGMAAIHYAAKFNRYSILAKICRIGADVTLTSTEELYTALHYSAYYMPQYKEQMPNANVSSSREAVELLINRPQLRDLINAKGKYSESPLHLACNRGNFDAAVVLINRIKELELELLVKDENGDTPLHEACLSGSGEIVDELLKHFVISGKRVPELLSSIQNEELQTPLHLACREGHTVIAQKLLQAFPQEFKEALLHAHDIEGNTALHLAVKSLRLKRLVEPEVVEVLLIHGANPSVERIVEGKSSSDIQGDKVTPLHIAASFGLIKVIILLIDKYRVNPDALDVNLRAPIHFAAMHNQPRAAIALIERQADIELRDVNGCNPFLLAAANGYHGVVAKLKNRTQIDCLDKHGKSAVFLAAEGAHFPLLKHLLGTHGRLYCAIEAIPQECTLLNIEQASRNLCSIPDVHLNTPLHVAAKLGHLSIVEELLREELVKSDCVKLDAENESKKTPAHLAAGNGHVKILEKLVEKCSTLVFDKDVDGNTPLHLAASNGWKHSVKLLIERCASVNSRNSYLATPLSLAARSGHAHVVNLLLNFKAEIDVRDKKQRTPLHLAVNGGNTDVVKVLLNYGAQCSLKDKYENNALDLAIRYGHEDVAKVIIHSDQWEQALRNTTSHDPVYRTPFRKLITKMPDVAKDVLNRCTIRFRKDNGEKGTKFNYRYIEDIREPDANWSTALIKTIPRCAKYLFARWVKHHFVKDENYTNKWGPEEFSKSSHPLSIMAESNDDRLISHPLVINLLMFKLRKYVTFFYLIRFLIHFLLLFFLTLFSLVVYNPNSDVCQVVSRGAFGSVDSENASYNCSSDDGFGNATVQALCGSCGLSTHRRSALIVAEGVVIIVIAIRICLTLVEFVQYPIKSLKSLQNWIKLVIFTCSIIHVSVLNTLCHCPTSWQWQIGTVAVLFVWFDLIIFIRKLQLFDIGIYVLMFESILLTFLHTVFLSSLLLIAFSLTFYMAFFLPGMDLSPFYNPGPSIVTVLTYVTGAVDYTGLFSLSHVNLSKEEHIEIPFLPVSIILWIIFLIIMVILLVNMLIGLAVNDINGIKKAAEVQRLKLLVDLTLSVDAALQFRHMLVVPEREVKNKEFSLWKACNELLWKGKIVQDTPESIEEALTNQSEASIEQVHIYTQSLVKEMASMRETIKTLNDRNRRIEATLTHITTTLARQFGTPPTPDLEI